MTDTEQREHHPWPPFIPEGAQVLILGTFPPPARRRAMDFYYPNRTNDFWQIMGLIFLGNRYALYDPTSKRYDLPAIKTLLTEHHIAMSDTGRTVRRLRGNASDKFLEIVEPVALDELLARMPECRAIATTGEKAAGVIAGLTGTEVPRIGEFILTPSWPEIWRMPSTSRAYPLKLELKAEPYARMFRHLGLSE